LDFDNRQHFLVELFGDLLEGFGKFEWVGLSAKYWKIKWEINSGFVETLFFDKFRVILI
jgi:hypothetical protein